MRVHVIKKVKPGATTLSQIRKRSLNELRLLTKYMTAAQMESVCKHARLLLLN